MVANLKWQNRTMKDLISISSFKLRAAILRIQLQRQLNIQLFEHTLDKKALVWFQEHKDKFVDVTTLKTMFLQRYNLWGKTKRDQLQLWNILTFDPQKTDVDEHIDLINTLGNMLSQTAESKMEKFLDTMPTIIQTHLITCKIGKRLPRKQKN